MVNTPLSYKIYEQKIQLSYFFTVACLDLHDDDGLCCGASEYPLDR